MNNINEGSLNVIGFMHRYQKIIIFSAVVLAFVIVLLIPSKSEQQADAATSNVKNFKCITIDSDDTLWSIAEENISEEYASIQAYIDEVKSINNLNSDKIYNGATLVIPYYAAPL